MLETILKHCTRWISITGLAISLQACDRPPSRTYQFQDGHIVIQADAALEKDGAQKDAQRDDGYVPVDALSDSGASDAQSDDEKYDVQQPDAEIPDAQPLDSTTFDGTVMGDALSPDSLLGSDGSLIPDAFPVDSAGYDAVVADTKIENPDAGLEDVPIPDASLADVLDDVSDGSLDATVDGPANSPPVFCSLSNYVVNEGELLEFLVCATDPDNDPLIFGAGNLPTGSNFSPATQLFSWTPTYEQAGQYQTTFLVSDGELFDVETIDITVLDTPCEKLYFEDADGDSYGNPESKIFECETPFGYVENDQDCDDTDDSRWQKLAGVTDNDGDGYGSGSMLLICAGDSLPTGYTTNSMDCNDLDSSAWAESLAYIDADGDGFGSTDTVILCMGNELPPGYASNNNDCDDTHSTIYIGAPELCDLLDNDCTIITLDGSGEAPPLNTLQGGVCADSVQRCTNGDWQENYSNIPNYESSPEVSCDSLDNDCDGVEDDNLSALDQEETQECSVGEGICKGYGLEYKICLGSSGWSEDYFNCDAVEGEPTEEVCGDELDNDCDGLADEGGVNILDDFNGPDQDGLGTNALGNLWVEYGTLDDWDIVNNAAETFWVGDGGYNPNARSEIGHREKFNILMKFHFFNTSETSGNGALVIGVNATGGEDGSLDGLAARLAVNNYFAHKIVREGIDLATGARGIYDDSSHFLRFMFDGSVLQLKLWEGLSSEPAGALVSAETENVPSTRSYLFLTGDMDAGEQAGIRIEYIIDQEFSSVSFADSDGDGFGSPTMNHTGCSIPSGYVTNSDDCDDTNNSVYLNAVEECDGVDNNCDKLIDEVCDSDDDGIFDPYDNCLYIANSGVAATLLEGEAGTYQLNGTSYDITLT